LPTAPTAASILTVSTAASSPTTCGGVRRPSTPSDPRPCTLQSCCAGTTG
jgi:hypothetical protein